MNKISMKSISVSVHISKRVKFLHSNSNMRSSTIEWFNAGNVGFRIGCISRDSNILIHVGVSGGGNFMIFGSIPGILRVLLPNSHDLVIKLLTQFSCGGMQSLIVP